MSGDKQKVTMKGTSDGLILEIDDACSFPEACEELKMKLNETPSQDEEPNVPVTIQSGNRHLNPEQKVQIEQLLKTTSHFTIQAFESEVIRRDEALAWKEESDVKLISRMIRSGQVLEVTGDLLLMGDVNPGGCVQSSGNIYVMGSLTGIAHAGADGDTNAIIAASYMKPNQLRIANYISRAPDYDANGVYMEYGHIDSEQNKILIDPLKELSRKNVDVSAFERRIQNG